MEAVAREERCHLCLQDVSSFRYLHDNIHPICKKCDQDPRTKHFTNCPLSDKSLGGHGPLNERLQFILFFIRNYLDLPKIQLHITTENGHNFVFAESANVRRDRPVTDWHIYDSTEHIKHFAIKELELEGIDPGCFTMSVFYTFASGRVHEDLRSSGTDSDAE